MASRNTSSPLGVGVVWVPGIEPLLEPGMNLIDVVEIEPQLYWDYFAGTAQPYRMQPSVAPYLEKLNKPVIMHGVGGAVGGTLAPPPEFTRYFHDVVSRLNPAWVSEHLSFLSVPDRDGSYFAG